ncbi:MAG TPA: hypothetical protein VFR24_11665 [Candidatus Angelobacter sp.]|nr:hypothetical protein [Candidatus Angelobacter sp.]
MLNLPKVILDGTFRTLRKCGRAECECALYWIGPATGDIVNGIEHPLHRRSPFGYRVDDGWLTQFWTRLAQEKLSIKAQIHTHPNRAFHSATDDQWPIISQPGFISIVIPDFAMGTCSLKNAWIGSLDPLGHWKQATKAEEVLRFV